MFRILYNKASIIAADVTTSNYHHLGNFVLSVGTAAISAGYSALSTEEGKTLVSRYINGFFGEDSNISNGGDPFNEG